MSTEFDRGVRIADKYEIIGPLGRGAYGSVYRAIQHPVERTVALKVISPHAATDEALRARFFREARAIARLNHPGVVTLHDYGDSEGTLYMVMEFVDGRELKQVIKEEAPLEPGRALDYVRQVVTVLVEAHGLELIHRDLKPANIMIVQDAAGEERVKILDFGIAKLLDDRRTPFVTQMGTVVGSPSYFSPEQAMGETCGPAADQYSVGVILYEMLTGKKPFTGNSLIALINAHRFEAMPPLSASLGLPLAMTAFLRRSMEKQPADRFPDTRAMLDALDILIGMIVGTDRPSGVRPVVDSGRPAAGGERRKKQTAPLPGLEADEQAQSGEQLVSDAATVPDPMPALRDPPKLERSDPPADSPPAGAGSEKKTAALIALGSAHTLYNSAETGSTVELAADELEVLDDPDELDRLPGVEVFNASSTIIRPPAPKPPRSPVQVALLVGGVIAALGLGGMWLISRNRAVGPAPHAAVGDASTAPADDTPTAADAAPADARPLDGALGAGGDAAAGDAAAGDAAVGDAAVGDAAAGDGATGEGGPGDGAADAAKVIPRPPVRRRRAAPTPTPPPPPTYQKL